MAAVPSSQARAVFTQSLIDVYREINVPTGFLRSFFPTVEEFTRYVSIEVMRGYEKVAVDVIRGTEGNRNKFSKSTEKVYDPPLYREYFDITEMDLYDRLFGSTSIDAGVLSALLNRVQEKMTMLVAKIERAYEVQCAQVLETGIVTLTNDDNIDFSRKATSLVANAAGNTWATGTVDPFGTLETGCNFLRQVGKATGGTFNAILGSTALSDLLSNTLFKARQNLFNMALDAVHAPQRNSVGATLHGQVTAGSYKVNLWAYPQFYDDANGTSTPYINPKKVILLPENPRFKMAFGAVPQLIDEQNPTAQKGAFVFGEFRDVRKTTHEYDVQSAGLAIPVAIDQIYTVQVVA